MYARWTGGETGHLYVESIALLGLSLASCAAVVIAILLSFIQGRQTIAESDRDWHVRNTWDFMVLILMVLELFQSLNWLVGTVISHHIFNMREGGIDESMRSLLHIFCKHIGAFTYCLDILLYSWNACLAYSVYSWVVKQALVRDLRMRMTANLVLLLLMSVALTLVPALRKDFGAVPGVVCWLRTLDLNNPSVIVNKLVILPVCWCIVGYCYVHTVLHLRRHSRDTSLPVPHAYRRLTTRLLLLACIFFFAWLLNSIWYILISFDIVDLPLGIVGRSSYGVGLLDALIYGHAIWTRVTERRLAASQSTEQQTVAPPQETVSPAVLPPQLGLHLQGNTSTLFVTTLNCGRCLRPKDLGRLEEWVPQSGYDIYVFGFQECRMLRDLRRAIHKHIGGSGAFVLFEQVLGDGLVWKGQIVLLVFARADDVGRGMFKVADAGRGCINNGVNFGLGRYHNKGAAGLAFQYYGTSVAFITAHFASDSEGKQRLERRNEMYHAGEDAWRTLHTLRLGGEVEDFDFHHQHDHVIVLGDLNYRSDALGEEILCQVAAACEVQKPQMGLGRECRCTSYSVFFDEHGRDSALRKGATCNLQDSMMPCSTEHSLVLPALSRTEHWEWVKTVDQLNMAMAGGLAFVGFLEGPVRFPPSFKMYQHRYIEDYADVEDLRYAYQLSKGVGLHAAHRDANRGRRPPSWTDRILYHSLPAQQRFLLLEAYDMCDRITGSDHRPVAAAFRMSLMPVITEGSSSCGSASCTCSVQEGRGARASQELNEQEVGEAAYGCNEDEPVGRRDGDTAGLAQHHRLEPSASMASRGSSSLPHVEAIGHMIGVSRVRSVLLLVKMTELVLTGSNRGLHLGDMTPAPPVLTGLSAGVNSSGAASSLSGNALSSLSSALGECIGGSGSRVNSTGSVNHSASGASVRTLCRDDIHEVVILLPTPPGDSLGTYRRVVSMEGHDSSQQASFSTSIIHRFAWEAAGGVSGLKLVTTVQTAFCSHAIIKFVDRHGVNLGEGVFALVEDMDFSNEPADLESGTTIVRQTVAWDADVEEEVCGQQTSVQLSVGGVSCGQVSFVLAVDSRVISNQ